MKRCPALAFGLALLGHVAVTSWTAAKTASLWGTPAGGAALAGLRVYIGSGNWILGVSYALSAAFVAYAFLRLRSGQKAAGAAGMAGGITVAGVLYFAGCFLLGCCGSPMLVVYLNLFGASFLGFTKPLVLGLTIVSLALGYLWMERRAKAGCVDCACEGGVCDEGTTAR